MIDHFADDGLILVQTEKGVLRVTSAETTEI